MFSTACNAFSGRRVKARDRLIEDEFEFATRPDHCYAIFGWRGAGDRRLNHADVAVRFAD